MTDETKKYNGWTNYETWNVALWLSNEEGSSSYWDGVAGEAVDDEVMNADPDDFDETRIKEAASEFLADEIQAAVEDANPLKDQNSTYSDMLLACLGEVNWLEIAEHYVDEVDIEKPETKEV